MPLSGVSLLVNSISSAYISLAHLTFEAHLFCLFRQVSARDIMEYILRVLGLFTSASPCDGRQTQYSKHIPLVIRGSTFLRSCMVGILSFTNPA
ncbi:hypothetical protein HD806DRAFT_167790 [Xylariaceae sp. AK1471]|nr:hypothetical protein HD806DRAFT_167790 [Xylariaceae sp. AK1471]